jgi:uncharacterized membrane protein YqiK
MELILYLIAIVIVMVFLVGVAILSVRLHPREEIYERTDKKKVQLLATDDLPGTDNQPRRSSFNALRAERTIV